MRLLDRARWEQRLASKFRILEDCIQRALDQLQAKNDCPGWNYVKTQVDLAHDAVIDAMGAAHVLCPDAKIR